MYLTYLEYCLPSSPFYERRDTDSPDDTGRFFGLHRDPAPEGWSRGLRAEWVMYTPGGAELRWQGWKIHVSATTENAEHLLRTVSAYCLAHRIPFKALSGLPALTRRNSKYADRGGSGKFITLYPPSDEVFASALGGLDALTGGEPGPTILSDLRYLEGPLYVRYGAFVSRQTTDASGRRVECVEDPDGNLVPDERRPGFHPPSWAQIPPVLEESIALRGSRTLTGFPYAVRKAVHFSNGGGVYLGERRDTPGKTILLKEARPYCGLDESGQDALTRLERERDALLDLAGLPGIPAVDAYVDGVEHKFLGRAYVEGRPLMELAFERNPLISPDSTMTRGEYAEWARAIAAQVADTVGQMHARGWVFGDLHPGNIIVDDEQRVHFIDFENASRDLTDYVQTMGVFGFRAPDGYRGRAVDLFALGCIRLGLLMPLTRLVPHGRARTAQLCAAAVEEFDLPPGYFEGIDEQLGQGSAGPDDAGRGPALEVAPAREAGHAEEVAPALEAGPAQEVGLSPESAWTAEQLAACLGRWRSPEREDRLFPGDIRQFLEPSGGLGLAYGAAGMLWALHSSGGTVDPDDLGWLRERVHAAADLPPGFWSGLAGIAYATEQIDPDLSDHCVRLALSRAADTQDLSLGSGLSGLGAYLLHEGGQLEAVDELAARVAKAAEEGGDHPVPGLVAGAAGLASFAVRAGRALDNPEYEELATRLLDLEVGRFGFAPGGVPVRGALPAFGAGIANGALGLAFALYDHERLTGSGRFTAALDRIVRIARQTTAIHNGLLSGRAGQVQLLTAVTPDDPASRRTVERCLRESDWYLTRLGSEQVTLGNEELKLSLDLGTGHAGLLVTRRAAATGACTLPLWERQP
ncbi:MULTISPECIES: class III lanthionine synthetase LanKC [unclassified Streptomyces]|uniref:class III lanthionine synthetase LanKC n=1 Tax=unclassified Streptomyces TaxID=2593676 RepID=UPI002E2C9333|nr:class III lanthionine synthetase LanKC [Streptomyces sp. NBC_00223]